MTPRARVRNSFRPCGWKISLLPLRGRVESLPTFVRGRIFLRAPDSINIPVINTGTQVAAQNGQNTGVQQIDLTTSSKASPVITVAGGQTVSLQLIEQSPINIDNVVLSDLAADYARQLLGMCLAELAPMASSPGSRLPAEFTLLTS